MVVHIQVYDAATGLLTVLAWVPRGWVSMFRESAPACVRTRRERSAAYGMPVCRFHGARRPDAVLRGPKHPQYRHGRETLEARRNRVEAMTRIRAVVDLAVKYGILKRRMAGRKGDPL